MSSFFAALDARLAPYNLLTHPYYQAWSAGELTTGDLRAYAAEYWHHVAAFPAYLSALHSRLPDGALRRTVLANLADEEGLADNLPHSDLWMDFAAGMGAGREEVRARALNPETEALIAHFRAAMLQPPAVALAALYAYESRVPAIAATKAAGLKQHYGASAATARYFTLHEKADVHHAKVWRDAIAAELALSPEHTEAALQAGEEAAHALWTALDGIERGRQQRLAAQA